MNTGGTMQHALLDRDRELLVLRPPLPPNRPQASGATAPEPPPARAIRPALLAGEDLDAPDQHIFRGTD
ncbi:hypothetical protein [Streptomyces sp. NPDC101178]|uniref:hypothetical protein n=1 Tax=Streptomyces sp. NPDC101178 TaxID=3366124 RepID=UPI0037FEEDB7